MNTTAHTRARLTAATWPAHARPSRAVLPGLTPMRARGDAEGTNRLPRTYSSAAMAFPGHCEYACALEVHRRGLKVDEWVGLGALVCTVLWAIWG